MNIKKLYRKVVRKISRMTTEEQNETKDFGSEKVTEYGTIIMGPMNGPEDKHPATIIKSCYLLGVPLPKDAKCGKQPSEYVDTTVFDGSIEKIIEVLGDQFPKKDLSRVEKLYSDFKQKYQSQECLNINNTDLAIYFTDFLIFGRPRGCTHNNYFDYEFYNKEVKYRDTFLKAGDLKALWMLNDSKHDYFRNKALFNKTFANLIKRDWCDCENCSFEEFVEFANRHERFFAKPTRGIMGAGARIIDVKEDTLRNIFETCQKEGVLAEEIVQQHEDLSKINACTLNTIRVVTLLDTTGEPHIMVTAGRFGREGNVVDNFHGGGVGVIIDEKTGKIITGSINRSHYRSLTHPDSGVPLLGFQYPEWEKVIGLAKQAAMVIPEAKHIGWDICITKDGEADLIEGNDRSGYDLMQAPDQIGRKPNYTKLIAEMEKEMGITIFKKRKPFVLDASKYECE